MNCVVEDTEVRNDRYKSTTTFIEDNLAFLVQHMELVFVRQPSS